jgi:hypothetical protein
MRRILRRSFFVVLILLATIAHADQLVRTLRLSIDSFATRSLGGTMPNRVVFTGKPLTATVMLAVATLPGAKAAADGGIDLPSARWWEHLAWDIVADAAHPPFDAPPVRT